MCAPWLVSGAPTRAELLPGVGMRPISWAPGSDSSSIYAYGLFFGYPSMVESLELFELFVVLRRLRKGKPKEEAMDPSFGPFSLCKRASEGMQLVEIPTQISIIYARYT